MFDEPTILRIFREKMVFKRENCILCPETLMNSIQNVYKNYFSRAKTLRIKMSQSMLQDLRTPEEQNQVVEETHERAHRGVMENLKVIQKEFYFPKMKKKIETFIDLCTVCKKAKYDRRPYKIEFAQTPIPRKPLDILHVDLYISQPNIFISAVDKFSRFGILISIKSRSIPDVRKGLLKLFSTYGTPKLLVSDNEPAIKSIEIRGLLQSLNVETYFTPADRSEVNGIVERFHSTLSEIYRCVETKYATLSQKERFFICVNLYNATIHSVTNLKPREIFYGIKDGQERSLDMDLMIQNRDKIFDEVILQLEKKQDEMREYHNQKREKEPDLNKE